MPGNLIHHPPRDTRLQRSQPPPHSSPQTAHSCPISDPPHANWWERPRESNELEGDQAAGPALGSAARLSGPAPSRSLSLAHKGEPNEAWGRNYTNANWQMSCIVPGYNKQYGCLSWISMRKGGAFWKLCFDCWFRGGFFSQSFLLSFIFLPFSEKRYFRTGAIKSFFCFDSECLSRKPGYFNVGF